MLICKQCNGKDVHVAVWVNPNTGDEHGDAAIEPWCLGCEAHVKLTCDLGPTHYNCCHAPKDMGHMDGCSNNSEVR